MPVGSQIGAAMTLFRANALSKLTANWQPCHRLPIGRLVAGRRGTEYSSSPDCLCRQMLIEERLQLVPGDQLDLVIEIDMAGTRNDEQFFRIGGTLKSLLAEEA